MAIYWPAAFNVTNLVETRFLAGVLVPVGGGSIVAVPAVSR
jgi:hypothetical protein